ncbi:MAG: arginase family protein [Candidatus Thorarchaeota archaeon]
MVEAFYGTFLVDEVDSASKLDGAIIGAPFEDKCEFFEQGSDIAPEKIRENSAFFSGQGLSEQSIHKMNFVDFGNCCNENNQIENLARKVNLVLAKNALPIVLGGDHSIALGTAQGIKQSKIKFDGIVWLDAHFDLMDEYPEGEKFTRATVLRRIIDLGIINPSNCYFIGVRGHNLGWEEVEFCKNNNMNYLNAQDTADPQLRNKFLNNIISKHETLYVSLDIDVLDPAFAPGISVPEPGGITSRELFEIITSLAKKTKCFDVVEVNPLKDLNDITAKIACKSIFHLIDAL